MASTSDERPDRASGDAASLAAAAWRPIFDFVVRTGAERTAALAAFGLTPNDSRALTSLDREEGRTMRSLADEWRCDASTATWIVDRLEERGFAERRALEHDRRVRLVVLTPLGTRTRSALEAAMYAPPPALLAMPADRLAALRDAAQALDDLDVRPPDAAAAGVRMRGPAAPAAPRRTAQPRPTRRS